MSNVIWNYVVPVDGEGRVILCHDTVLPIVEVAWEKPPPDFVYPAGIKAGTLAALRFWTMHKEGFGAMWDETHNWEFRVFGTGHEIPDEYEYLGTAPRTEHNLVWHLFRREV
jgi:hypothetical protein